MKHELYSELRTIFETTVENPHTFRVTLKMKDMIDGAILKDAVGKVMHRHPYFAVRLVQTPDGFAFEDNEDPVPVLNRDDPCTLAGPSVNGHLLAFCWWKNMIHLDIYHALTDGGGIYELIKALIYYYCSAYYGKPLSSEGIRLTDDPVDPAEWTDPAVQPRRFDDSTCIEKWHKPAFQLKDGGLVRITPDCLCYNIRIPEAEFMRFNLSNDGSPGTIISLLLARAIEKLRREQTDPVVIAMCVNQRRALRAPLAHQSLVGDVRIVFSPKVAKLPFLSQATSFRGIVALQSDSEMVLKEIGEYADVIADLRALPDNAARHAYCVDRMNEQTRSMTATVSYVGKANFGDAERYIQEFHVMPSTALPSSATPLTLELSAVNGSFYVNFMQYFTEDVYLNAFLSELRENEINYDVLDVDRTKYPLMEDLWH